MNTKKYIFSIIIVLILFVVSLSAVSAANQHNFSELKNTVCKDVKIVLDDTQYDNDFLNQPNITINIHEHYIDIINDDCGFDEWG